ncbi:MAG TPA: GAF domain-containing protein, partial [Candidatus Dormibacteraeota bacterium]|nr:GAF domain-containing protein [Candidatus Dormibacteraeota bacterium]
MRILPLPRRGLMQSPNRAFQALHEVAVAAAGLRDPKRLAELLVDRARDLLEADAAALYWWYPEVGLLRTLAHNDPREKDPEPPFKPTEGAAGRAFSSSTPIRVDDYASWPEALPTSVRRGIQSGLAVPLTVSHRAIGALGVFNRRTRSWTEDEEQLLMLFAAQVAPALEAARLTQETIEQAHNFRALHEVAIAAGGLRDLAELGRLVVDRARQLLKTESATLRWWDASTSSLRLLASVPALAGSTERIAPGAGSLGQAFERREPAVIDNYVEAPDTLEWAVGEGIRSALGVPVMAREEALGALGVATTSERTFGREEIRLLTMLAAQVGPALEAARLYAESERRRHEAEALAELVRAGAGQDDTDKAIALIVEQASRLVGCDYAMVVLTTPDGGTEVKGHHGTRSAVWARGVAISATGHPAQVLAAGATVVLPAIEAAEHPIHRAEGGRAAIGVPLREAGRLIGVMILGWRQPLVPDPEAVRLAEAVAGYAATIIDNVRSHERERHLAVEAAARSAELAAVIDHIPAGVYVADLEGRIVLMNPAGVAMMAPNGEFQGDALGSLDGFTILDPVTRRPLERRELAMSRALRGEQVDRAETVVQLRGSPERYLESSAVPLRNAGGTVSGALVIFSDITREKSLVGDLAASEERFRTLYGMVACGVLVQEAEGRVLDANGPAQEMLGWSLEEMRGKRTGSLWEAVGDDLKAVPFEERPTMLALRTKRVMKGQLLGIRRRGGDTRWLQVDTIPVFHPDGSPLQVVSSFIDITERKAAEER